MWLRGTGRMRGVHTVCSESDLIDPSASEPEIPGVCGGAKHDKEPTPRNPMRETALSVQFVPGMPFLAFDFRVGV
eukprot:2333799-Rhodomonas_salina.2